MHANQNDAVALVRTAFGLANTTGTAGGAGDNTQADAAWIDRLGFNSVKVVINYTTALSASQTLGFAAVFQDATSGAGAGAAAFGPSVALTTAATGAGTRTGTVEYDLDLSAARQFIRARITPDLSAGATDTFAYTVTYVLGGATDQRTTRTLT